MRSKQLLKLKKGLSELNRHYSHYLFISEQFNQDNRDILKAKGEQLVKSVYQSNIFSSQFNVRLKELPKEIDDTKKFIIKSFYILCFANFEIYVRDLYNFIANFQNLPELNSNISPITQLINNLSLNKILSEEEIDSLTYLRLRRNALIHRDSKKIARGELLDHIKAKGKRLNKYWLEQKIKIKDLDFSNKKNLDNFNGNSVIELINIIRRLAEKIDSFIMSEIGEDNLLKLFIEDFCKTYPEISRLKRPIEKFNHYLLIEYGAIFDEKKNKKILGE